MRRAYLDETLWKDWSEGECVSLPAEVAHYFSRVLRLSSNTTVELFDGLGRALQGTLRIEKPVRLQIETIQSHINPLPHFELMQAMVPSQKLELITRQCTELGLVSFTFFDGQRSKPESMHKQTKRIDRLQKISIDAVRQSGRYFLPRFSDKCDFDGIVDKCQGFGGLVAFGEPRSDQRLSQWISQNQQDVAKGFMFVNGPEGGFNTDEEQCLRNAGAQGVLLGPHILRTETAPAVAFAAAQAALGWM